MEIPESMRHIPFLQKPLHCKILLDPTSMDSDNALTVPFSLSFGAANCKTALVDQSIDWRHDLNEFKGGRFHVFRVTHKFPILRKVCAYISKSDLHIVTIVYLFGSTKRSCWLCY